MPHLAAGARAAVRHSWISQAERAAATLRAMLRKAGLPALPRRSHILPAMAGDAHFCRRIGEEPPKRHGIDIQPIDIQPIEDQTVPRSGERLRITPSPLHPDDHIRALVGARRGPLPSGRGEVSPAA